MYLDFYELKEFPFNVTSDPAFLYLSNSHKEALDHLVYGIEQKKGFIEVTGEIGSGKTTLCKALLSRIETNSKSAFIFNSSLQETQLLEAILNDFGITARRRSKVDFLSALNSFLLEQLYSGVNTVLLIDEAQNLKPSTLETIRMLSNMETNKEKLLQIILVGQPQLRDKLDLPSLSQLRQRISVRFRITPLNKFEVGQYIDHRLRIAGSPGDIIFPPKAVDQISRYSGGIPRVINLICDKSLLLGFVLQTKFMEMEIIEKSIRESGIKISVPVM